MKLDLLGKKEILNQRQHVEKNDHFKEGQSRFQLESIAENNLCAKAFMVTELVEMGFSLEAIERILKLESEVLDQLL